MGDFRLFITLYVYIPTWSSYHNKTSLEYQKKKETFLFAFSKLNFVHCITLSRAID